MDRKTAFDWKYLIRPEDGQDSPTRLAGACKAVLWFGVSVLAGLALDGLC
jgi:hypothetical protein